MTSMLELLRTIEKNPHVDLATRLRAGYLVLRMTVWAARQDADDQLTLTEPE